jgi:pimeloyl-ACP methyl ester carboxylesterase
MFHMSRATAAAPLAHRKDEIEHRYPDAWRSALKGPVGDQLKSAEAQHESCAVTKAGFGVEMAALQSVDSQAFHNWQQFYDQRFQRQQSELDSASGLRNTKEMNAAYFGPKSKFPCYCFSAFSRLTMPALIIVGQFDGAMGVEQMRKLATDLPNARFDEFGESGHFVYAEEPLKFVRDVEAFLTSTK